jgi:hypothetical protein
VRVVAEPLDELLDVLVDERVVGDVIDPPLELRLGRELAEDQEVGDLEVGRVLAELLDRYPAMLEHPRLPVDERDRRAARCRVGERRVVGHQPKVVLGDLDLAQVHGANGPVRDLDLVGLAGPVVGDRQRVPAVAGGRLGRAGLLAGRLLSLPLSGHLLLLGRSLRAPSQYLTLRLPASNALLLFCDHLDAVRATRGIGQAAAFVHGRAATPEGP